MTEEQSRGILVNDLKFTDNDIDKLFNFHNLLLDYNLKYNLISRSTENSIWSRHILDSAQLVKYFDTNNSLCLSDFGSGAGFPGLVLAIYNKNPEFHVKLYEKSPVKREFLDIIRKKLKINFEIEENVHEGIINADILVSRAFKKIEQIIKISRENMKKSHKIIILKGKNAQSDINDVSLPVNYSYKMENSITDSDSKIIIIKVK